MNYKVAFTPEGLMSYFADLETAGKLEENNLYDAPEGFDPKIHTCVLENDTVRIESLSFQPEVIDPNTIKLSSELASSLATLNEIRVHMKKISQDKYPAAMNELKDSIVWLSLGDLTMADHEVKKLKANPDLSDSDLQKVKNIIKNNLGKI